MSDYPMLISNKLHSFRNFLEHNYMCGSVPTATFANARHMNSIMKYTSQFFI